MKIIICILVIANSNLQAQTSAKYLLNSNKTLEWSIYISPEIKYTYIFGTGAVYGGIKGAILYNNHYAFGLTLGGILTETDVNGISLHGEAAEFSPVTLFGGFYLDYVTGFDSPFQISFPTAVGAGGVMLFAKSATDPVTGLEDEQMVEIGIFTLIEPKINLEISLTKTIRVGAGGGYRFVLNTGLQRFTNKDLAGPILNLNIKLGIF